MTEQLPYKEVRDCVNVLREGGLILYPTDTIWGIGCDATNYEAVQKIFRIKKREAGKSMLILAADVNMVDRYINQLPDIAEQLFEQADNPLTIILPDAVNLADGLAADDQSIGIRIPDDTFCLEMLQRFRRPIVSTSANFSGDPSPSWFGEINPELIEKMDYVVKWRQDDRAEKVPSSIIKINVDGTFKIIR
jgi:L-threonylcarbamoyladenylate synthase